MRRVCSPLEVSPLLLAPFSFSFIESAAVAAANPVSFVLFVDNVLFKASSSGLCTFSNVVFERSLGFPCNFRTSAKAA